MSNYVPLSRRCPHGNDQYVCYTCVEATKAATRKPPSAVDALYSRKPNWPADNRSEAVKMQQELWQQLGTLHRIQANLDNIMRELPPNDMRYVILRSAGVAINNLIKDNRAAMKNLPNKKRKALLTKDE